MSFRFSQSDIYKKLNPDSDSHLINIDHTSNQEKFNPNNDTLGQKNQPMLTIPQVKQIDKNKINNFWSEFDGPVKPLETSSSQVQSKYDQTCKSDKDKYDEFWSEFYKSTKPTPSVNNLPHQTKRAELKKFEGFDEFDEFEELDDWDVIDEPDTDYIINSWKKHNFSSPNSMDRYPMSNMDTYINPSIKYTKSDITNRQSRSTIPRRNRSKKSSGILERDFLFDTTNDKLENTSWFNTDDSLDDEQINRLFGTNLNEEWPEYDPMIFESTIDKDLLNDWNASDLIYIEDLHNLYANYPLICKHWSKLDVNDQIYKLKHLDWNIPQMIDAITNHDHNKMMDIISQGFDIISNSELLIHAINTCDITAIEILIDNCADVNAGLDEACRQNNYTIVELLINSNADITLDNHKALVSAVKVGSIPLVKLFLNAGLDISKCLNALMAIDQPIDIDMENWLVDLYC